MKSIDNYCIWQLSFWNLMWLDNTSLLSKFYLKVQSYKLYNKKSMIDSTQMRNTEIFTFIAVLVFKLIEPRIIVYRQKKTIETVKK